MIAILFKWITCPACNGTKVDLNGKTCSACQGSGQIDE